MVKQQIGAVVSGAIVLGAGVLAAGGLSQAQEIERDLENSRRKGLQDQPASAPQSQTAMVQNFLKMDTDGDGQISTDEATGLMKRFFARNDANGDGQLDQAELKALAGRLNRNRGGNPSRRNTRGRGGQRQNMNNARLMELAGDSLIVEADVAYRPGESKAWRLDLIYPRKKSDKTRPAIVFVHGGGWRNGDKRTGYFIQGAIEYARRGYVCITVNYRLVAEASLPAAIEDTKCAVRWLRAHAGKYNIDPERVGGYGNSAGAHLVAILGVTGPEDGLEGDGPWKAYSSGLNAVAASATPTDFLFRPNQLERLAREGGTFHGAGDQIEKVARNASPLYHASVDAPPFLLFHGTGDTTVPVGHSDRFVGALRKAGAKDVTYVRIDGLGHGVFGQKQAETHPKMEAFFKRTLGE